MYKRYTEDIKAADKVPMKNSTFRQYYKKQFKSYIKLHPPQLDACNICLQFHARLKVEKDPVKVKLLKEFLEKHYKEADDRYIKMRTDKMYVQKEEPDKAEHKTISHSKISSISPLILD
jgi:hypothetical protein